MIMSRYNSPAIRARRLSKAMGVPKREAGPNKRLRTRESDTTPVTFSNRDAFTLSRSPLVRCLVMEELAHGCPAHARGGLFSVQWGRLRSKRAEHARHRF